VSLRNEAAKVGAGTVALQDLLPEEASAIPIALLRLAMSQRAGRHWTKCLDIMTILRSIDPDDDDAHTRLARDLDGFATDLAKADPQPPKDRAAADAIVAKLLAFIGRGRLTSLVGRYQQGSWLDQLLEAAAAHLAESSNGAASWEAALDAYEGLHATPLMTIHKSKGLEYHTVIFVGLDDSAWWSFKDDETEATAGFFVAFTRARQRVVFTFCALAARTLIAPLYDLLAAASVKTIPKG
ncbi:MAG: ATP-binding domain-containing protein, partial [Alphaproteobacteria bacterium]|nr:ATP-binding domain-containing protein [Alphaproteobacteria bacterium]